MLHSSTWFGRRDCMCLLLVVGDKCFASRKSIGNGRLNVGNFDELLYIVTRCNYIYLLLVVGINVWNVERRSGMVV